MNKDLLGAQRRRQMIALVEASGASRVSFSGEQQWVFRLGAEPDSTTSPLDVPAPLLPVAARLPSQHRAFP